MSSVPTPETGRPDGGALAGRVVIVTGAARGLGRAYTELMLSEGAAIVANDIDSSVLRHDNEPHEALTLFPGDIADPATAPALVERALTEFGHLDAVMSNAGLLRSGLLLKVTADDVDAVNAVHIRGTFLILQAAASHWRAEAKAGRRPAASVLTTTSGAGLYGFVGEGLYSAAKAAVAAMTVVAAAELARYGVTVNAIAPIARTRLTSWMPPASDEESDPYSAARVAPVAAWLLSDDARDITGRVVEVGGDRLAIAERWRAFDGPALPLGARVSDAGERVRSLVAEAPPPLEPWHANQASFDGGPGAL